MGETINFGFNKFGPEGRLSDNGYKFSLKDRELMDALFWTLMNHDHQAVSTSTGIQGLSTYPDLTLATTGGALPAARDYYYKISYLDANNNETDGSIAATISTPDPLIPPTTQVLTTATTGGTLEPGTYKYAMSFYQASGETTAPNISTIVVPTGTSTNKVTIPLETLPDGATGWKIYRKGPSDLEYWLLDTETTGTEYVDDGSITPDCTKKRATANTTNSTNKVTITIPAAGLPLDTRIAAWRIYRTSTAGVYGANSLVATVSDTTTEGGTDLVTSYNDLGASLLLGTPLTQTAVPPSIPQLDASDAFGSTSGRLPSELAPLGVRQMNMLLPGTLTAKDYNQFFLAHDVLAERIDAFFITAPTGLDSSNYLTIRFTDDSLVDEVQSVHNDATTQNEIQRVSNNATGGTFTLSFDGQGPTNNIAYNADAATIETRLETDLSNITDVLVSGTGTSADPWVVEFVNPGDDDQVLMTADDTNLVGGTSTITESVAGSDGGTFTLSDGTDTTSAIAYDASAATIETRLETDITAYTNVSVTGSGTAADPWLVTFINPGDQDVDMMIASDTNLNGTTTISEVTKGRGNSQIDLVVNQNQQYHYYQTSTTDEGEQEAEDAPAVGGVEVSDTLATNDAAMELDTQNERNYWQIDGLEAGTYDFFYWVADPSQGATFSVRVNELTAETQSVYNNSTTGTFTLTFDSAETTDIAYNASAATVEAALEALSTINACTVTGSGTSGDPWLITFDNPAGNVSQLTADDTGMDGTSTIATTVAGTSTNLEQSSITDNRPVYTPAFELQTTLDGTEIIELEVEKTDATANVVRVDKYGYEVVLPRLYGGQTVTVEVVVTGSPTTNGGDAQVTLTY